MNRAAVTLLIALFACDALQTTAPEGADTAAGTDDSMTVAAPGMIDAPVDIAAGRPDGLTAAPDPGLEDSVVDAIADVVGPDAPETHPGDDSGSPLTDSACCTDAGEAHPWDADGAAIADSAADSAPDAPLTTLDDTGALVDGMDSAVEPSPDVEDAASTPADSQADTQPDVPTTPSPPTLWAPCQSAANCDGGQACNLAYGPGDSGLCVPRGGLGTLCTVADDCISTYKCKQSTEFPGARDCRPPWKFGGACPTKGCANGMHCSAVFDDPTPASVAKTCLPPGSVGAACLYDEECASPLRCSRTDGSMGVCLPQGGSWEVCEEEADCASGATCDAVGTTDARHCVPAGETQTPCETDLECPASTVCLAPGTGDATMTGVCRPPGVYGALCAEQADCAPPFKCRIEPVTSGGIGLCVLPGATEIPCSSPADCGSGFACIPFWLDGVSVCAARPFEGLPCDDASDCLGGTDCSFYFGNYECRPAPLPECANDSSCASGEVCQHSYGGVDGSCLDYFVNSYLVQECHSTTCDGCVCCSGTDQGMAEWYASHCKQCVPAPGSRGPGEQCGRSIDCIPGMACAQTPSGNACAPGADQGAACATNADCTSGLVCVLDAGEWTCRPVGQIGDPCDEPADCEPHLRCPKYGDHVCEPAPLLTPCNDKIGCGPGQVCRSSLGGFSGSCHSSEVYVVDTWCWKDSCGYCYGQMCSSYDTRQVPYSCAECVPADHTVLDGGWCMEDVWCVDGLVCASNAHCAVLSPQGGPCGEDPDCEQGLICVVGACAEPASSGEPCDTEHECLTGLRCRPAGAGHACLPEGVAGALCDTNADCTSDLRCLGTGGVVPGVVGSCGTPGLVGAPCAHANDCDGLLCVGQPKLCQQDGTGWGCSSDSNCPPLFVCDEACHLCVLAH